MQVDFCYLCILLSSCILSSSIWHNARATKVTAAVCVTRHILTTAMKKNLLTITGWWRNRTGTRMHMLLPSAAVASLENHSMLSGFVEIYWQGSECLLQRKKNIHLAGSANITDDKRKTLDYIKETWKKAGEWRNAKYKRGRKCKEKFDPTTNYVPRGEST